MGFLEKFKKFTKKILKIVKGRIEKDEEIMLEDLLNAVIKRESIYIYTILALLGMSSPKRKTVERFSRILDKAIQNIMNGKPAFSSKEKLEVIEFFKKIGLGESQAHVFTTNLTLLRLNMLNDGIKEKIKTPEKEKVNV